MVGASIPMDKLQGLEQSVKGLKQTLLKQYYLVFFRLSEQGHYSCFLGRETGNQEARILQKQNVPNLMHPQVVQGNRIGSN